MKVRQEPDTLPKRMVLGVTAATIVAIAIGVVAAWLLARGSAAALGGAERIHEPRERAPSEIDAVEMRRFDDRATMRPPTPSRVRADLERWHWANRRAETVQPPIDAAIELFLSRADAEETVP